MADRGNARPRYRFGGFTLSPARRALTRDGREIPLIPRYFDLLVLLLERRHEAIARGEIFDAVWSDVVVSDGALSQAVRTLRRALGDDPREPVFIRTIARHGYSFVHPDVVEEKDEAGAAPRAGGSGQAVPAPIAPETMPAESFDPLDAALARLLAPASGAAEERDAERRDAAESLHQLGTAEALRRLDSKPGHERARALLRDARWDVPGAGEVPLLGEPGALQAVAALVRLRLGRALGEASKRWGAAAGAGATAGLFAGLAGGLVMRLSPDTVVSPGVPVALALAGAAIGGLGAAGVGAGLAAAEALARSFRGAALVIGGAVGGGAIGFIAHFLGRLVLQGIFGGDLSAVGGGLEGIMIGGMAGLGYGLSTPRPGGGGMATPRGRARLRTAVVTGVCCAAGGILVNLAGGNLSGTSLDFMARSFSGSGVGLTPLAHLLHEGEVGPVTRAVLSLYEGFLFGFGLVLGLTRRPRPVR